MRQAIDILSEYESGGFLPDMEEIEIVLSERWKLDDLINRYTELLIVCEEHESTRHSRPSNSRPSSAAITDDKTDWCDGW